MNKYFIHKQALKRLTDLAKNGGGYQRVEVLVVMKDFELMVPDAEEREQWIQIRFLTYGGGY